MAKNITTPATDLATLVGAWLATSAKAESATVKVCDQISAQLDIRTLDDLKFFKRPAGEEKQNNRHVVAFDTLERIMQESVTLKGKRLDAKGLAMLRDPALSNEAKIMGFYKGGHKINGVTQLNWKGQVTSKLGALRNAMEGHIKAGMDTAGKPRDKKAAIDYIRERVQQVYTKARKADDLPVEVEKLIKAVAALAEAAGMKLSEPK